MKRVFLILLLWTSGVWCQKAIVIGASSGMGREVAKRLSEQGYTLGLVARRLPLLESLQKELETPSHIACFDVRDATARKQFADLIKTMGEVDLVVISISCYYDNAQGTGEFKAEPSWENSERCLDVDCKGFIAMAEVAFDHFMRNNKGHFVGISSTSGLNGNASTPIYSGVKACLSTYMKGMRNLMARDGYDSIFVTDIIPGYVAVEHSPLGEDPNAFWEITVEEAGDYIIDAIMAKKKVAYVPSKVWALSLLAFLPDCIYQRYFNWL